MTNEEKEYLEVKLDNEGFDYAFMYYSDFSEIEDKWFHKLRKEYVEAATKLRNYIELEDNE